MSSRFPACLSAAAMLAATAYAAGPPVGGVGAPKIEGDSRDGKIAACAYAGKVLAGRVRVTNAGADFNVRVVDSAPDLRVKRVARGATACGEWEIVDGFADFSVRIVEGAADFTIEIVDDDPGVPE